MRNEKHKGPRELCAGGEWIYGRNPVIEALRAGRRTFSEVILPPPEKNEPDEIAIIRATARDRGIIVRAEDRKRLDLLTRGGHHQGVAIKTAGYPYVELEEILEDVRGDENATVLVLDHLEDPQNVGSILRTACAIGVRGVILPEDRSCGVTPAAVRASAGASEYLKVARVVNLVRAMKQFQEAGMWFTGLDWGEDAKTYTEIDFKGRTGLVVGAEGDGISRLVRETCDFIAVLPMPGEIESLNAGVAAAVCMYEVLRQRR
ncbi:MAG: 23S rRNA (guanosine(2251)-2'-O)-methyltransferase RlmB [Kiritimatiellia bacterium]